MERDAAGEHTELDAAMAEIRGPFTATMNDYVRNELVYKTDLNYEVSADVRLGSRRPT